MRVSLKITICLMTASVSLLSVSGNKGGPARINCDNAPVNQTAHVGGSVTINCNYSRAEESTIRYFCKENENFGCMTVIETQNSNYTKRGKSSLKDIKQQRAYTVTISELTEADAGRYKCAMKNDSSTTCSTEVHLHISTEKHLKTKKSGPQTLLAVMESVLRDKSSTTSSQSSNSSETGMIVGVAVSLTLLVIAVVILILCRHKHPRTQGGSSEQRTYAGNDTEGNHGDHHNEEILENLGNTLPSIYVTVNLPTDQVHYASVHFQKNSVGVSTDRNTLPETNTNGSSCDYSSVSLTQGTTHPPAEGQVVYSTLNLEGNML